MGKRVVLLLVLAVVMMALFATNSLADEVPTLVNHGIDGTCEPNTELNCLDVSCKIMTGSVAVAKASISSNNWYTLGNELKQDHINIPITDPNDLEALTVKCEFPEFKTMYCTHRSVWSTEIIINRRYNDVEGNSEVDEFILDSVTAFECEDWVPPRVLVTQDERNYQTGNRTLYLRITDDENSFLMDDDDTGLSHCGYKILNEGESYSEVRKDPGEFEDNPTNTNAWTRISECILPESTELLLEATRGIIAPMNKTLLIYAEDTERNFRYHEVPALTIYPSLPASENNGFCPRQNQCLIYASGDDTVNDFSNYDQSNHDVPVCVNAGSTVNDIYCDSVKGLIGKSERILDIAILAGIEESTYSFLAYCNPDTDRYGTYDNRDIFRSCSNDTMAKDVYDCMNPCMLLYDNRAKAAVFSSTNQIGSSFTMPRLIGGTIASCTAQTTPFEHQKCIASVYGTTLNSVYVASEGLLHAGLDYDLIVRRLQITSKQRQDLNDYHVNGLLNSINSAIGDYYFIVLEESEVDPSMFKSSIGTHRISAFMKFEDKYALGLAIPTQDNLYIVSVAYRGYSQADLNNFIIQNQASIITLRESRVYTYGDYVVIIGFARDDAEASDYIERLVNRINVK